MKNISKILFITTAVVISLTGLFLLLGGTHGLETFKNYKFDGRAIVRRLDSQALIENIQQNPKALKREDFAGVATASLSGSLRTLSASGEENSVSSELVTAEGIYKLYSFPETKMAEPGSKIEVTGYVLEGLVVAERIVTVEPPLREYSGQFDALVITFNWQNDTSQPFTRSQIADRIFTAADSTNNFLKETSYNNVSLNGDTNNVTSSWYTVPYNKAETCTYSGAGNDISNWSNSARAQATSAGYNLANYDRIMYIFPTNPACGSWAGLGEMPGDETWFNGYNQNNYYSHELGHNFGAGHSGDIDCGTETLTAYGSCSTTVYGDDYDVMGNTSQNHFNAIWKNRAGWLPDGKILEVTASGTYTIEDLETAATGYSAIKIAKPNTNDYYLFEYRQATGFDSSIPAGVTRGLIGKLYTNAFGSYWDTFLLDFTPANGWTDVALANGSSFSDTANKILVSQVSTGSDSVTINVTINEGYSIGYYCDANLTEPVGDNPIASLAWAWGETSSCELVDRKLYLKISMAGSQLSAPVVSIDSEGTNNDVVGATTVHLVGNEYLYTRVLVEDTQTGGYTDETIKLNGNSTLYGLFTDSSPTNPTYQTELEVYKPVLQTARIVKKATVPYNRQLELVYSELVWVDDITKITSPSFSVDSIEQVGDIVLLNISGISASNTGFTSNDLSIAEGAVTDDWLNPATPISNVSVLDGVKPEISAAVKTDTQHGPGLQAGDKVAVTFTEPMTQTVINKTNINNYLPLIETINFFVYSRSWLDGSGNIGSATWVSPSVLEIALSTTGGAPNITGSSVMIDTGYSNPRFSDASANTVSGGRTFTGTFDGVIGPLDHIDISPATTQSIVVGQTKQFTAVGHDQYHNVISGLTYAWTGTNASGLFTGTSAGSYSVSVSSGGKTSQTITVNVAEVPLTPMYRLYNTKNGAYLYVRGEADKNHVMSTWPEFEFTDGVPAFYAPLTAQAGLTPIYRLYNTKNGMYLYTRGEADRNHVTSTWPEFEFTDGVPAFYASLTDPHDGSVPMYRLYNTLNGAYLYTRGAADRDHVLGKWPEFEFTDGVPAYYAPLSD